MYSVDFNTQVLIRLLKHHGIKKIIVSPGTTNISFAKSVENDDFFTLYSSIDERSAAYLACGLSEESQEVVCLSCTGATASRNYLPALTEAYYRKLPILVISGTQNLHRVGHLNPQLTNRVPPPDCVKHSVYLPLPHTAQERHFVALKANIAVLELFRNGGGPVHINLETSYSHIFNVTHLPKIPIIHRITTADFNNIPQDSFAKTTPPPALPPNKRIAIALGSHSVFNEAQIRAIESFCEIYNAVVFVDHTSGYFGKYRVFNSLVCAQQHGISNALVPDLIIHLGEISAYTLPYAPEVWRVSKDGEIRDLFGTLTHLFDMHAFEFFDFYNQKRNFPRSTKNYFEFCQEHVAQLKSKLKVEDLPFSNLYVAAATHKHFPPNSRVHLGILNTLRVWNFFELPQSVESFSNVGGFGIDGTLSATLGASLFNPQRLYFAVLGDLAFFYDMNALGNRHIQKNLRILLINNGKGAEFRLYSHLGAHFGESTDPFTAAAGHFGNQSPELVKHFAQSLGFLYFAAHNKEELQQTLPIFFDPKIGEKPILWEIFTTSADESDALFMAEHLDTSRPPPSFLNQQILKLRQKLKIRTRAKKLWHKVFS